MNWISPGRAEASSELALRGYAFLPRLMRPRVSCEALARLEFFCKMRPLSSAVLDLSERQLATLIERGRGWPWNGYELRLMKEAGKYPPARVIVHRPLRSL